MRDDQVEGEREAEHRYIADGDGGHHDEQPPASVRREITPPADEQGDETRERHERKQLERTVQDMRQANRRPAEGAPERGRLQREVRPDLAPQRSVAKQVRRQLGPQRPSRRVAVELNVAHEPPAGQHHERDANPNCGLHDESPRARAIGIRDPAEAHGGSQRHCGHLRQHTEAQHDTNPDHVSPAHVSLSQTNRAKHCQRRPGLRHRVVVEHAAEEGETRQKRDKRRASGRQGDLRRPYGQEQEVRRGHRHRTGEKRNEAHHVYRTNSRGVTIRERRLLHVDERGRRERTLHVEREVRVRDPRSPIEVRPARKQRGGQVVERRVPGLDKTGLAGWRHDRQTPLVPQVRYIIKMGGFVRGFADGCRDVVRECQRDIGHQDQPQRPVGVDRTHGSRS